MKHAKRMILVPEDVFNRFEQKQKIETSPIVSNMLQKDTEMSQLLHRKDLDDVEKQKLYHANMERYLNLKHQKDSTVPTVRLATNISTTDEKEKEKVLPQETVHLSDSVIVDGIPKTMRSRASAVLNRLKARPDVISWDETGKVSMDGVEIPHSNISDLISDAVRARKRFNPTGSKEFFRVLSKINMPRDLVRNEERWKQAQIHSSPGEDIAQSSSQITSPSKYFQTLVKRHKDASKLEQTQKRWLNY